MAEKSILEAVKKVLEESPKRNFSESVDLAINLKNLDMNLPKNRVDEEVILPHGLGKELKIGVFAKGDVGLRAKAAGAAYVISDVELDELASDKTRARTLANECDLFIAETQFMPTIGKNLGIVLGPRGKMPIPLLPNKDIGELIQSKQNAIRLRSKDKLTFHVPVGRRTMSPDDLAENVEIIVSRLERVLDKGRHNLRTVYVTTTMGKSERVV
ncbi:LSU ribosomal protein L10Ae (L1p) [Methanosarcina barkeri str. Wiesmoor]|uniref:Large ribosomal subunit protein uL1 n=2 Tax=Methanosarcina barkeri TaxID=2208 RepID=RL1_METBF|nr:50S ribosomal protein L1 [Methanosarcina barkeri]Q46EU8.1 RecName: Full=Large ribosomal subunit protein uL1; AltName: Full=50S ribosomal protein L1 [Methanosarcina barkeri str. Fusaro]AKB49642.1 LSU ribosomal protein L10Ae (L1p) [Methanosarcina barkeri str. Wiesmoor]